jgi:hypothetical protein
MPAIEPVHQAAKLTIDVDNGFLVEEFLIGKRYDRYVAEVLGFETVRNGLSDHV